MQVGAKKLQTCSTAKGEASHHPRSCSQPNAHKATSIGPTLPRNIRVRSPAFHQTFCVHSTRTELKRETPGNMELSHVRVSSLEREKDKLVPVDGAIVRRVAPCTRSPNYSNMSVFDLGSFVTLVSTRHDREPEFTLS